MAAPRATANTINRMRTTATTPMGILPHNFLLRQLALVGAGSAFSEKLFSVVNNDADDESDGSAGTVLARFEFVYATLPVCVSGLCGGKRAGVTAGNKGAVGGAEAEKDIVLKGDTGETGVMKGSSGSTGVGAGITRDALASAAIEALVGPSSGNLEYGGSCSVCPSGPIMSCSSPSGPRTLW